MIVYLKEVYIFKTPTTKVKKYTFTLGVQDIQFKTKKEGLIEYWRYFDTVEDAETYLNNL